MSYTKFAAFNRGAGQMVDWGGNRNRRSTAPRGTRAADTTALGSLGGTTLSNPTLVLPRPGAPEPINFDTVPLGCSGCGGNAAMGAIPVIDDVADALRPTLGTATTPVVWGLAALAGYKLLKAFTKR